MIYLDYAATSPLRKEALGDRIAAASARLLGR